MADRFGVGRHNKMRKFARALEPTERQAELEFLTQIIVAHRPGASATGMLDMNLEPATVDQFRLCVGRVLCDVLAATLPSVHATAAS